ncbi:adipogenesis regulatory factor-like [Pteronotus mesoamericanus]|uniref:adipogenesis regulatory factor-like n=1 Tax=Pteronotus mesoamericanus TaxID=1884717 RepID=UPI0023ECF452|nr:adipogenesis regulatory factor-like [Pteronotus parnellii mesoamericanus]
MASKGLQDLKQQVEEAARDAVAAAGAAVQQGVDQAAEAGQEAMAQAAKSTQETIDKTANQVSETVSGLGKIFDLMKRQKRARGLPSRPCCPLGLMPH